MELPINGEKRNPLGWLKTAKHPVSANNCGKCSDSNCVSVKNFIKRIPNPPVLIVAVLDLHLDDLLPVEGDPGLRLREAQLAIVVHVEQVLVRVPRALVPRDRLRAVLAVPAKDLIYNIELNIAQKYETRNAPLMPLSNVELVAA